MEDEMNGATWLSELEKGRYGVAHSRDLPDSITCDMHLPALIKVSVPKQASNANENTTHFFGLSLNPPASLWPTKRMYSCNALLSNKLSSTSSQSLSFSGTSPRSTGTG